MKMKSHIPSLAANHRPMNMKFEYGGLKRDGVIVLSEDWKYDGDLLPKGTPLVISRFIGVTNGARLEWQIITFMKTDPKRMVKLPADDFITLKPAKK